MDAKEDEDSVNRIEFTQNTLYGKDVELPNIDKVQATIIRLRRSPDAVESKNKLIAMLETLLGNMDAKSKYHQILTSAAVSQIPCHSAVMMTNEGIILKSERYLHEGGNE